MDTQDPLESRASNDPVTQRTTSEFFLANHVPVHITCLISANYHKIFHLKALRDRDGTDVAEILRDLNFTETGDTTPDEEPTTPVGQRHTRRDHEDTRTQLLAKRCMELRKNICRAYEGPMAKAETIIKAKLEELNCTPLPFCGHQSNLDDLCLLLYAATSAEYYRRAPLPTPDHQPTDVVLEFVDFLYLAGGRPASSFPHPCDISTTFDDLIEIVRNVYDYLESIPTLQEGGFDDWDDLPAEEEVEGWRFQCAAQIEHLDMAPRSWEKVSPGTFDVFKTAARTAQCFIMHTRQIEIFWAIKAKQRHLHANDRHGSWTWAIWQTEEADRASEVPYVPLLYMPAFEPDDLPPLLPSAALQRVVKTSKDKKRKLPMRTPEEQAAKKDLSIRLRKRQRG
ncbi:hypothetical protein D6C98_08914 [Aureobasidium pullulans]|uniref:Uncharacterized protein n=1 Tax=Aureobasidium pullulans TaxID=5580 RepID=A0A4S9TF20_AURPU|nr:hypothetical protein D6D29_08577 [Aureobasidium pullulans]THW01101.1 hypothetical protein D6D26_05391 [Aureobasidium pullulans]THW12308.1 hypothetical protein D6D24_06674 [Aureobasidium pullulans]THY42434.1 hypothetical protein D6C98_08914 [Aureobasidium pullulans]THZ22577.1 hypothetical protein D6C89_06011 [Aureobasidium pullulans]